uniref:Non-LTR retroelement reverse transcriptase-like n=1 Tax=Arabidopsis thaliana TaxID=3702 RepID=Q9FZP5_ARATH|nr:non-LTR retroelement reverse transcriptase-like [Arabidopsis thaliana]
MFLIFKVVVGSTLNLDIFSLAQQSYSALQAEVLGFLHALQMVWIHGYRYFWFEGDNLELKNLINKIEDHHLLDTMLYDIRFWMAKLPYSSIGHVTTITFRSVNAQFVSNL